MITLTTPKQINSVLGGNTMVAYEKMVLSPFTMDPVAQTVSGAVRITSTSAPTMQPITGTFRISVPSSELVIEVAQLDFVRRLSLTAGQNSAVLAQIEAALAQLENGLVSLGVVAGVRGSGP